MGYYDTKKLRFEYNVSQKKIYLVIFTGISHIVERIALDEGGWEKLLDTVRKAGFEAERNNWGKSEIVMKAEEVLRDIQINLDAEERNG